MAADRSERSDDRADRVVALLAARAEVVEIALGERSGERLRQLRRNCWITPKSTRGDDPQRDG
jgi:hypothetical protein